MLTLNSPSFHSTLARYYWRNFSFYILSKAFKCSSLSLLFSLLVQSQSFTSENVLFCVLYILSNQGCQLSRFWRVRHAFTSSLTLSPCKTNLMPIKKSQSPLLMKSSHVKQSLFVYTLTFFLLKLKHWFINMSLNLASSALSHSFMV